MAGKFDKKVVLKLITEAIPMGALSKIELEEFERGYVRMRMPFDPNQNHLGTMYAGAVYTLAEIPGGAILISAFNMMEFFPTLASSEMKYVSPIHSDVIVDLKMSEEELKRIESEARETGKSKFVLNINLHDI